MTRANTEQLKYTPWLAKAGAACSIVPIVVCWVSWIDKVAGGSAEATRRSDADRQAVEKDFAFAASASEE